MEPVDVSDADDDLDFDDFDGEDDFEDHPSDRGMGRARWVRQANHGDIQWGISCGISQLDTYFWIFFNGMSELGIYPLVI